MKKAYYMMFVVIATLISIKLEAQLGVFQPGDYRDGIYDKENSTNRRYIPYTHLREGDVTWEKRVWRELDLREKQNQQLYYPIELVNGRNSLFQVLSRYILKGEVIAFSDEEFLIPFEPSAIKDKLKKCDSIKESTFTEDGTEVVTSRWNCDSTSIFREIYKYKLKEDWFFDKQKSVLEVRIIGIGAYQYVEAKDGYLELFWVYFPACRPFFAKHEVYNAKNDSERRTFEDVFWKRQFSSVIVKETNVYDRRIAEYSKGIDALLESDRIKMDIFKWEHDLWHF
jgi:gliding motility associated protien GldN